MIPQKGGRNKKQETCNMANESLENEIEVLTREKEALKIELEAPKGHYRRELEKQSCLLGV